jgi:hypothetical protein
MKPSKFLKQDDIGAGQLVTIRTVDQHNVAASGAPDDNKWCASFNELDKPLVLNSTNMDTISIITGSLHTDGWIGKTIVLFVDPSVVYAGKRVGGIRVRAPKPGSTVAKPSAADDNLPF